MSIPSLDSSRSTCLMACFVTRPRASARPCPIVLTARDAVLMTPSVALARDSTRLACRSPSNRFSRKRFTCGKSGVWSGFIGRPANRVTCGEIRGSRDSGNRKVTNERLRIRTGRPGFFMESHGSRLDFFITRRIQSKIRGCIMVQPLQFHARVLSGELPVGFGVFLVAASLPGLNLLLQHRLFRVSPVEALDRQNTEFGFSQIQPASMLWRVVPFEPFDEPPRLGWRKRFVKRRRFVRIEIVLDEHDFLCVGILR